MHVLQSVIRHILSHFERTVGADYGMVTIVGPFFFENNREMVVTVNSKRYRGILADFL